MKKILILLVGLLIFPALLYAESSYFLACQEGKIIDQDNMGKSINFTRGDLFEVLNAFQPSQDTPKFRLTVHYGNRVIGRTSFVYLPGYVDLASGCWFKSESPLPIKNKDKKNEFSTNIIGSVISSIIDSGSRTKEEYFEKFLDQEFVDSMCSEHPIQFSAGGINFTDIGKEKEQLSINERIRQENETKMAKENEAKEEQEKVRVQQDNLNRLKKYGVEAVVSINLLEVNPYEFEGRIIAVVVQFKKMLSKNSASFYSGYSNLEDYTNVHDEIIVTGIPTGTHFESGFFSPMMMLALKGNGTIKGTNAFGAIVEAPHFQWIGIVSGKQPSMFERQRNDSRQDALNNMKNASPRHNP